MGGSRDGGDIRRKKNGSCPWNFSGKNTGVGCSFSSPGDLLNPGTEHTYVSCFGRQISF